jgi:hypothetical protein
MTMAPKKMQLKSLKKGVHARKAGSVKGGSPKKETTVLQGLSTRNHNMVVI